MMARSHVLRVVIAALLSPALGASAPPARVAFLQDGDVWVQPLGPGVARRATTTGGKVEDYRFSPLGDYLAYAKNLGRGRGRPVCSIVIVRVASGDVVTEIQPGNGWIDIDKWPGTSLVYHASAAMEVSGVFEFDAARGTRRDLDPEAGSQALDSDATPDAALLAYVDDVGLGPTYQQRLHLVDTATGADAVQTAKRSLMAPAIAPARDAVAFVEVAGEGKAARDRVWLYRRSNRSVTLLDDHAVEPKSAGSGGLAWSPDGRYVSVNFTGTVTVLDAGGAGRVRAFRGAGACWSGPASVVVASGAGLDLVNVGTGAAQSLVARGARPQCLPQ